MLTFQGVSDARDNLSDDSKENCDNILKINHTDFMLYKQRKDLLSKTAQKDQTLAYHARVSIL